MIFVWVLGLARARTYVRVRVFLLYGIRALCARCGFGVWVRVFLGSWSDLYNDINI